MEPYQTIGRAEQEITNILKNLEVETGLLVDDVRIDRMDISTHETLGVLRQFRIKMLSLPGKDWG